MTGQIMPMHLGAGSLWTRYGFTDGQPFEFEDRGQEHDDDPPHDDWTIIQDTMSSKQRRDVLELLVRRHLVPAITKATGETPTIVRVGTQHNPLRDSRYDIHAPDATPDGWSEIWVEVSRMQIMQAVTDVITTIPSRTHE